MSLSLRISLMIIGAALMTLLGLAAAGIAWREDFQSHSWGPRVASDVLKWSHEILESDEPWEEIEEIHEHTGLSIAASLRDRGEFEEGRKMPSLAVLLKRKPVQRAYTRNLPNELSLYQDRRNFYLLHRTPDAAIVYGLGRGHLPLSWIDHLQFTIGAFGALAVLFGTVVWLTRRTLRPLSRVSTEMEGFARPGVAPPPRKHKDEIKRVSDSYEAMRGRVEALIAAKEALLRDVSHEIRSPLARIRLRLELMEDGKWCDGLAADVAEIDSLAGELLDRAYLSADQPLADVETLDLAAQARLAVASQQQAAEHIQLSEPEEKVEVRGNARLLRRAITNLLVNSLKYSRLGEGSIRIGVAAEGGDAVLTVADQGERLDGSVVARLFEPFYRPDDSRTRKTGGHGLGLALVESIAAAHGGSVSASSPEEGGLAVEIRLPRA